MGGVGVATDNAQSLLILYSALPGEKVNQMSSIMDADTVVLTRSGLLGRVSDDLKMSVMPHHLIHAQRLGFVSAAPLIGGWNRYTEQHVVQLSNYMKTYSRSRPLKNGGES